MNRYFEIINADGYHVGMSQEVAILPRENMAVVTRAANRLLANQARVNGWKPFPNEICDGQPVYVHIWHHDLPFSKRMELANGVHDRNGNPPRFSKEDIAAADGPGQHIAIAQFDKDGKAVPSMVVSPLGRTSMPTVQRENAAVLSTKTIVIQDMGHTIPDSALPAGAEAIPVSQTIFTPSVMPIGTPAETMAPPAPIEAR